MNPMGAGFTSVPEGTAPPKPADPMMLALALPLAEMGRRYVAVQLAAAEIVAGMEAMAERVQELAAQPPASRRPANEDVATTTVALEVSFSDDGTLLDFQDHLMELEGVLRVSVIGAKGNVASILVELEPAPSPETALEAGAPTVVCVRCGRTLSAGTAEISHGLCPDCTRDFLGEIS